MSRANGQPQRQLVVTDRRVDGVVVVTATGEVDIATGPDLEAALVGAAQRPDAHAVVLDMNGLTFLGSRGLAAVLRGLEEASRVGRGFRVAIRNQSPVYRVLEVTGLDKELTHHETVEDALRSA